MVKVHGMSDSEISFITFLNSCLKVIKINSFEDYQNYHDNYREEKRRKEEDYDDLIDSKTEGVSQCYNQIKQDEYDLQKVEWDIRKKESIVNKYWGKVQEDIQNQISNLKRKKRRLNSNISELKDKAVRLKTDKDSLIVEKKEFLVNYDKDIHKLFELEKNDEFKKRDKEQ